MILALGAEKLPRILAKVWWTTGSPFSTVAVINVINS
jgi:hypothetical protein